MVTVITEKLRNQTLDDVRLDSLPQTSSTWKFSTAFQTPSAVAGMCKALPTTTSGAHEITPTFYSAKPSEHGPWLSSRFHHAGGKQPYLADDKAHSASQEDFGTLEDGAAHKRFLEACMNYEAKSNTPPLPPTKRHCRSLSVPSDNVNKWQPQASSVWRPVASRSHLKHKSRNSPQFHHKPICSNSSPHGLVGSSGCLTKRAVDPKTCSWPFTSSDDSNSPPISPIPRPASAIASVLSNTHSSASSSSSLYTTQHLDPNMPLPQQPTCQSFSFNPFRTRSLSMEEPTKNYMSSDANSNECGSLLVVPRPGSASSVPLSPHKQRVPRCHSQPSVLLDRKTGMKRRREEERPSINFLKMKETTFGRQYRPRSASQNIRSSRSLASLFTEPPESFLGLNTIASSPADSNTAGSLLDTNETDNWSCMERENCNSLRRRHMSDQQGTVMWRHRVQCEDEAPSLLTHYKDTEAEEECTYSTDSATEKQREEEMFEIEVNPDLDLEQIEKD